MIKNFIKVSLLATAVLIFVQCKEDQKVTPSEKTENTENTEKIVEKKQHRVGGWQSIDINDTVKDLADFVIADKQITSPIKELSNASTQIVSGKNYKFDMLLENGELWTAQVYVNIQKEKSVTTLEKK